MKLSTKDKNIIAANASFLDERIGGCVNGSNNAENESENELMRRWRTLTSFGDNREGFERRIKLSGKTEKEIEALLDDISWNDEKPIPEWMATLEKFFGLLPASYEEIVKYLPDGTFKSNRMAPFQHIWAPWLKLCYDSFVENSPEHRRYLSETAEASWLRYVLDFFNKNFSLCLNSSFDLMRFNDFMFFSQPSADSFPEGSTTHYDEFSKKMTDGGWLDFFKKYSVAARLISIFCGQQSLYLAEAVRNLAKDANKIRSTLGKEINPGIVKNLEAGLSDHHNGGKSVIRFEFESGLTVFYKPRSGDVDTLWTNLLNWLEGKMSSIKFKTPLHIEGDGCSWVENIANLSLEKKEDAHIFYYKAGAIMALIYVLGGTDFHQENLMADGCDPVLIDLETMLNPLVKPFTYTQMSDEEKKTYSNLEGDSVLRTCMLPLWTPISKDVSRDYGALTPDDNASYSIRTWLEVNTDRMRRGQIDRKTNPSPNVAHFKGELVSVIEYKDDILKGFEDVYKFLMNERAEFLNAEGPLKMLHGANMRYLPRQSQVYGDMIDRLRSPGLMRNGAAFSIEAEGLAKPFLNNVPEERVETLWKIFDAERRSILSLNIPLFEFTSERHSIFDHNGPITDDYYLSTAIEEAERRVMKLSGEDMEFQSNMIDASLLCRYPDESRKNSGLRIENNELAQKLPDISSKEYIETAKLAADEIAKRVIFRNQKPQWLTLKSDPIKHINFIGPVDMTLYEGSSGIGLFLAAYEKISGDKTHHKLALKCFCEAKELLDDKNAAQMAANASLGYCGGIPGILWALYTSGKYLNDEETLEYALKGIELLGTGSLENDSVFDIIGGAAGGILAALALYDSLHQERLLNIATDCAESLISKRFKFDKWKLWPSNHAYKPLTGFAHGSSGYALTLAMVYERTRIERFREAALEAIDYEAANYIERYKNWPDYRHNRDLKPGETAFMGGWCSGAPGVGLARIKLPKEFQSEQVKADIENSLSFTRELKHSHELRDHLCCGYAGRIDFLIEAAIALDRPELMEEAKRQFSFIVNRARKNGRYTLSVDDSKSIFTPGLFTGTSGIGMCALRIADNGKMPTPLVPKGVI